MILTPEYVQDGSYPASHLRVRESFLRTPGVLSSSSYVVTAASGLNVSVSAGAAYVAQTVNAEGGAFYNGLYLCLNDASTSPYNTITAPLSNPRLDQVILRVYDVTEQAIAGSSFARVEWLPGSENAGATYPNTTGVGAAALPANSLLLAYAWATVGETSIAHVQNVVQFAGIGVWQKLTLASGINPNPSYPYARLEGDVVRLKGGVTNASGSASLTPIIIPSTLLPTTIAGIGAPELPSVACAHILGAGSVVANVMGLGPTGMSLLTALPNSASMQFDGLTYSLMASPRT